jgi:hypothetical protein
MTGACADSFHKRGHTRLGLKLCRFFSQGEAANVQKRWFRNGVWEANVKEFQP